MIENRILEQYLELAMWKTNIEQGANTCGKYPRCLFCLKREEYPCAKAYFRCLHAGRIAVVPEGGFPEPPAREFFGDAIFENRPKASAIEGAQTYYTMSAPYAQEIANMIYAETHSDGGANEPLALSGSTAATRKETMSKRRIPTERVLNVRSGFAGERTLLATLRRKRKAE